jgi:hypothetical protein
MAPLGNFLGTPLLATIKKNTLITGNAHRKAHISVEGYEQDCQRQESVTPTNDIPLTGYLLATVRLQYLLN